MEIEAMRRRVEAYDEAAYESAVKGIAKEAVLAVARGDVPNDDLPLRVQEEVDRWLGSQNNDRVRNLFVLRWTKHLHGDGGSSRWAVEPETRLRTLARDAMAEDVMAWLAEVPDSVRRAMGEEEEDVRAEARAAQTAGASAKSAESESKVLRFRVRHMPNAFPGAPYRAYLPDGRRACAAPTRPDLGAALAGRGPEPGADGDAFR